MKKERVCPKCGSNDLEVRGVWRRCWVCNTTFRLED